MYNFLRQQSRTILGNYLQLEPNQTKKTMGFDTVEMNLIAFYSVCPEKCHI